ncbi:CBS domain-containing protein [Marinospirillum celere]|uniref:CBS domain-containing protein n=1 Tax=Marinospirillum celere TaxID=1122252 RepID=A0A1I1IT42_9GAMM|nr:CBS domain-containing protein [Marinospirillum celere]SFC39414.1 CBS domain-containing protein [Marinospirillum celere]
MVFPIHEQGLRIHTPKNQVLQRPAIRQTQATTAGRRLVDHDGDAEHDQNISDQTWLGRQLTAKEKQEEEEQATGTRPGSRAIHAYEAVEQSRKPAAPHLPASHIMRSPVITLEAAATLNEAWQLCQREGIHYLVLTDTQGELEGIVSERDLLAEAAGVGELSKQEEIDLSKAEIRVLIRKPLITAQETTDVRDIARLMLKHKVRAVPVINDKNELLGLVTRSDLMLGLANQSIEIDT